MPGLLNMDPTAAGLMALGGNMVRGDFGGGLLGFNQAIQGAQEANMRGQLGQAQIADMQQQMELRKAQVDALNRKNTLLSNFLNGGAGAPSQPAFPGQLGSGSFGVVPPPAGQPSIPAPQGGGGFVSRLTPDTLAALKLGADADLTDIFKLTQPDMQVSNGYAYDRRTVKPGFIPQANISQNGQATVMTIGPDGMPRVSLPNGSLEAYSAFRNADESAKAGQDLVKIVGPDGAERYVTRSQAVQATQPAPAPRPAASEAGMRGEVSGPMGATPADYDREIAASTQALQYVKDPASRAQLQQHIAEMQRQKATYGPLQASPTTQQAAQAAAEKERQTQIAKDITEQRKSIMNADFSAPTNIAKMQKIGQLLSDVDGGRFTPNGTEVASALNSLGIKIDKNLGNKQAAAAMANEMALQLRSPQGGAGMPGALSDKDREFLASMTPNQAQSLEGRNQVINAYVAVQKRNQQVAQFARNYEKKYGRLDNGFFDQMAAWSNAHPLFGGK